MTHALVDQEIKPVDHLTRVIDGRFSVEVGVESDREQLIDALQDADVLLTTSRLPVDRTVLSQTDLELVGKLGTGLDNVDLEAARELGVPVTYTPGLNAKAVAEYTVLLALAVSRNLLQSTELLAAGGWRDEGEAGSSITGRTIGIIGFGRIGTRIAGLLSGFNVDVLAYDPYVYPEDTDVTGGELTSLEDLLRRSDVVTVNAELTDETRGMIGPREFELMKASAVFVNTARGPIVQTSALIEALETDQIAGAGLDVFESEPLPPESPLHDFETVVSTPHIAAMTTECRKRLIERLVENVRQLLDGDAVADRYMAVAPGA